MYIYTAQKIKHCFGVNEISFYLIRTLFLRKENKNNDFIQQSVSSSSA